MKNVHKNLKPKLLDVKVKEEKKNHSELGDDPESLTT